MHPATVAQAAELLERWEHVVLPAAFIGIGMAVLAEGHAFCL